ncbi:MAG: hypothetical protein ACM31L_19240 [Actinomycetota bacterium]
MTQSVEGQAGSPVHGGREAEPVPVFQRILDNPFLLLFIGVTVPAVSYTIWGIMEVAQLPIAK